MRNKRKRERKQYKTPKYANDALLLRRGGRHADKRDKAAQERYMADIMEVSKRYNGE